MSFFFFNDTATTEIYPLSLHDALPICSAVVPYGTPEPGRPRRPARRGPRDSGDGRAAGDGEPPHSRVRRIDRKSTRLNSSHANISYAVFCLKKKKNT